MKATKLALATVLASSLSIGAMAAPSAFATQANFTAEAYPAVSTIRVMPESTLAFETKSDKITCVNNLFETLLGAASKVATVTPHFSDCVNKNNVSVTIELNGCHFTFEALTYTSTGDTAHATAGIKCAKAGEAITVSAFTCAVHIPEQTGLKTITLRNEPVKPGSTPKEWIKAELGITNLTYTETDGFLCPFEGENHAADGKITGELEVKGFESAGTQDHATTTGKKEYLHGVMQGIDVR